MPHWIPYKLLEKQKDSTSCWITVAAFYLLYLDITPPPLNTLREMYMGKDHSKDDEKVNYSVMKGAGNPALIVNDYLIEHKKGYYELQKVKADESKIKTLTNRIINELLKKNLPVICGIQGSHLQAWFKHAVVIVGYANQEFGIKDPMVGDEIQYIPVEKFFMGFLYKEKHKWGNYEEQNIWGYAYMFFFLEAVDLKGLVRRRFEKLILPYLRDLKKDKKF